MTISFITPGSIDLEAAFTFGMSAKETENPIGFFGTGLKYAVATLLRTGHTITLKTKGEAHQFTLQDRNYRGADFKMVCLDDKPLGFTTELGKLWEVWMAFRELHSNTLDEGGVTENRMRDEQADDQTIITVRGTGIDEAYAGRRNIFCDVHPIDENEDLKVRPGQNFYLFYRGIRAYLPEQSCLFTYDIIGKQQLTEDRTFASEWSVKYDLARAISTLTNVQLLRDILTAPEKSYESTLEFQDNVMHSPQFLQVIEELFHDKFLNKSVYKLALKKLNFTTEEIQLDDIQKEMLRRATEFLTGLGFDVTKYPVKVCDLHGPLAQAKDGVIYLTPQLFRMGTKYVALGVFEEFIHLSEGVRDMTRQMQTILFETIISMGEKIVGYPI